jgi:hypothetical protein
VTIARPAVAAAPQFLDDARLVRRRNWVEQFAGGERRLAEILRRGILGKAQYAPGYVA